MHEKIAFLILIGLLLFAGCVQPPQSESGPAGETQTTLTPTVCPVGTTDCQGRCATIGSDSKNCGGCGVVCESAHYCSGGKCTEGYACREGETRCDAFVCRDLKTNRFSCGSCTVKCSFEPPVETCCNGTCKNLHSDPGSCGSCGNTCSPGQFCCDGNCVDQSANPCHCDPACSPGETCCNRRCVDLLIDKENCGECGNACSFCSMGMCLQFIP